MKKLLIVLVLFTLIGCESDDDKQKRKQKEAIEASELQVAKYKTERNQVDTIALKRQTFKKQLNSNGKLSAIEKSNLRFGVGGEIVQLSVKNGQHVKKGDLIAKLDSEDLELKLIQTNISKNKAELDMKDYLIGQGYNIEKMEDIPADILEVSKIRSGYASAVSDIAQLNEQLQNRVLIAPFDGKIANLELKQNEYCTDKFCTILNDNYFDVVFSVLETEISFVKEGNDIRIYPFYDAEESAMGKITEINPVIDEKGLVKVKALVKNDGKLMEGMNVKVHVEQDVLNQLVVPKSAVVIRDNLEVLFRYSPEGKAMWTYVHTTIANSKYYAVVANTERNAELNEGDKIIISGNLNLAEGSEIEIRK